MHNPCTFMPANLTQSYQHTHKCGQTIARHIIGRCAATQLQTSTCTQATETARWQAGRVMRCRLLKGDSKRANVLNSLHTAFPHQYPEVCQQEQLLRKLGATRLYQCSPQTAHTTATPHSTTHGSVVKGLVQCAGSKAPPDNTGQTERASSA